MRAAEILQVDIDAPKIRVQMALREAIKKRPTDAAQLRMAAEILLERKPKVSDVPEQRTPPTLRNPIPGGQRRKRRRGQIGEAEERQQEHKNGRTATEKLNDRFFFTILWFLALCYVGFLVVILIATLVG